MKQVATITAALLLCCGVACSQDAKRSGRVIHVNGTPKVIDAKVGDVIAWCPFVYPDEVRDKVEGDELHLVASWDADAKALRHLGIIDTSKGKDFRPTIFWVVREAGEVSIDWITTDADGKRVEGFCAATKVRAK